MNTIKPYIIWTIVTALTATLLLISLTGCTNYQPPGEGLSFGLEKVEQNRRK